jgi:1-acyl-sn-glycerol-3-phosphate acyltransferase
MSGPFFVSDSTPLAAARSVLTYIAIVLYIAVVGPPGLLLSWAFRSKRLLYLLGHGGVGLALRLAGIRYKVIGRENVPRRAVVYCSNHESNVDPAVLFQELDPMLHIFYKAELHKVPLMGLAFDIGGFVAVERSDRHKSFASVDAAADSLRRGNSFLIFPEGTRSRTGELLPFKKGGFIMALKAQVPVIPVAVSGGRASMRKGSAIVRPVRVTVRLGEPIPTEGLSIDDRDLLIERTRTAVAGLLAEGSGWN